MQQKVTLRDKIHRVVQLKQHVPISIRKVLTFFSMIGTYGFFVVLWSMIGVLAYRESGQTGAIVFGGLAVLYGLLGLKRTGGYVVDAFR